MATEDFPEEKPKPAPKVMVKAPVAKPVPNKASGKFGMGPLALSTLKNMKPAGVVKAAPKPVPKKPTEQELAAEAAKF